MIKTDNQNKTKRNLGLPNYTHSGLYKLCICVRTKSGNQTNIKLFFSRKKRVW